MSSSEKANDGTMNSTSSQALPKCTELLYGSGPWQEILMALSKGEVEQGLIKGLLRELRVWLRETEEGWSKPWEELQLLSPLCPQVRMGVFTRTQRGLRLSEKVNQQEMSVTFSRGMQSLPRHRSAGEDWGHQFPTQSPILMSDPLPVLWWSNPIRIQSKGSQVIQPT